ncbi:hypothetical protein [Alkalibacillus haloalkaliphilus]|uniref:hypothetical protein n=1 Tax=Alkalibacillus haloalkaliphilus TaxID=94136 RepID=UPI00030E7B73|nr:hypothetical protein [Alkalibacillus haloalkaliphilus]
MVRKTRHLEYTDFYKRLEKQVEYLSHGGTNYRLEAAKLSLQVAEQVKRVSPFLTLEQTKTNVLQVLPTLDQERLNDVTKVLYVNAKELEKNLNKSDVLKATVDQRLKNNKTIKLVKAKN